MRYCKITVLHNDKEQGYCVTQPQDLFPAMLVFDALGEHDKYIIEPVEMSNDEFNSLPETNGF